MTERTSVAAADADAVPGPIFIQGIAPRSGTNHLLNLLCVHPDCASVGPVWEDHLLTHAHHLERYVRAVSSSWEPAWGTTDAHADALRASLGAGIEGFLRTLAGGRRPVTKTPRVDHLLRFRALFPTATLLVLVRDGRAVVESDERTFGGLRDRAIHDWARAARTVLRFQDAERGGPPRHRVLRYEALVSEPEQSMRELLGFLGLDPARYDFEKARNLPVRGSSTLVKTRGDRVHWDGDARDEDFDPLRRFEHWSPRRHARFNWIAGDELARLGYGPVETGEGALSALWNRVLDLRYRAALALRPAVRAVRRSIASR